MSDDDRFRRFVAAVSRGTCFVEVAKLVCLEAAQLGVDRCIVSHHASSGQPVVAVDNIADQPNDVRLSWVANGAWKRDALYLAMLARHGSVVEESDVGVHTLLMPIVEPDGVLGSIRCICKTGLPRERERELLTLASVVSVRLTQLGVTSLDATAEPARLTRRQRDVAELAARGLTNLEIGAQLGISMNTVKNRLKEAFERLDVRSRVELVAALHRSPAEVAVPFGISHQGPFAIARARSGPAQSGPGGAE